MIKESLITILTTTYNREGELEKLYTSLKSQNNFNFIWMIIDDGSDDKTADLVKTFDETEFPIEYYYKNNGGKHTAINYAMNIINTRLVTVVDSDDELVFNAVQLIYDEWKNVEGLGLAGLVFLKANTNGKISGSEFQENTTINNLIELKNESNQIREVATVWDTEVLKLYPFPELNNEKYIPEGVVTDKISEKYNMLFVNKVIYLFEYLKDGLTSSGRKLRINNPLGGMYLADIKLSSKRTNRKQKVKWMVLYICYGLFAGYSISAMYKQVLRKNVFIFFLPIGFSLYWYWKLKY